MPAVSQAQQRLMGAAEHGADFPEAKKLRDSMSHKQLHDFASGPMTGKPQFVAPKPPVAPPSLPSFKEPPTLFKGDSPSIVGMNTNALKQSGQSEFDATRAAVQASQQGKPKVSRHDNLGKFLHPRKDGKPHGSF